MISAYDISTYDLICTVPDSKGCTLFSTQERESLLVTINRKKISFYLWQSNSFEFCGDRSLGDVPRMVRCTLRCVVLGYRRHYEAVDVPPRHSNLTATTPQGHMSLGKYLHLHLHVQQSLVLYYGPLHSMKISSLHHTFDHISTSIITIVIYMIFFLFLIVSSLVPALCVGTRILDVEKEHSMCCLEIPECSQRSSKLRNLLYPHPVAVISV